MIISKRTIYFIENSPCNSPSSSKNEIILVDLSETSGRVIPTITFYQYWILVLCVVILIVFYFNADDEESDNSINDAVQYESQINGAQNEILEESEASDDQIRFEIKTGMIDSWFNIIQILKQGFYIIILQMIYQLIFSKNLTWK